MGYQRGVPQSTVIFFITGEEFYLVKYYGVKKKRIKNIVDDKIEWEDTKENYIDVDVEEVDIGAEGVVKQPMIVTIDGNAFLVWQSASIFDDGVPGISVDMEPFAWVKSRLKLEDEDLDTTTEYGSVWGIMRRTFPLSSRVVLSDNPEKPIWLLLTNINGDKINWDNPNLAPLIDIKMQLDRQEMIIKELQADNEKLHERNIKLIRGSKELKEEYDEIYGEKKGIPAPSEFTPTKIRDGKVVV